VPEQSQQQTLRALGADGAREIVERYVAAWERCDVDAFAAMLSRDASFAMPPLASWYRGRDAIRLWAEGWPLSGSWRWRALAARANAQPALGFYAWSDDDGGFRPFALNVLGFAAGREVCEVTAFIARSADPKAPEVYERYPEEPVDERKLGDLFGRFGLPQRLT
jgi:RNA polymerase sigma-70 factor (ECF subfamily)